MKTEKTKSPLVQRALKLATLPAGDIPQVPAKAVLICSHVLDACIWLAFDPNFEPDDDEPLAVFHVDEIALLKDATPEMLRLVHQIKLEFGGGRVRQ